MESQAFQGRVLLWMTTPSRWEVRFPCRDCHGDTVGGDCSLPASEQCHNPLQRAGAARCLRHDRLSSPVLPHLFLPSLPEPPHDPVPSASGNNTPTGGKSGPTEEKTVRCTSVNIFAPFPQQHPRTSARISERVRGPRILNTPRQGLLTQFSSQWVPWSHRPSWVVL